MSGLVPLGRLRFIGHARVRWAARYSAVHTARGGETQSHCPISPVLPALVSLRGLPPTQPPLPDRVERGGRGPSASSAGAAGIDGLYPRGALT